MATQAAKMMLFQNGKPFPAQLLRGSLLRAGATNTNAGITRLITDPITKSNPDSLIISQYFLGLQSAAGLDIGAFTDISILNRQFGVFANAEMGRVEARGKKTVADDSEEDSDDSDGGHEEYGRAEDDCEELNFTSNDEGDLVESDSAEDDCED